ncbi:hypothetical protein DFQ30_003575 [Apophysomyces sp. BC1015]|nr:hypothetical protein DFQ30_003575 [Apophysomyces sp. BC1015]
MSFYDSDEDDMIVQGNSDGVPGLDAFLQNKEAEEIPLKKSRFNIPQQSRPTPVFDTPDRERLSFKPIQNAGLNNLSSTLDMSGIEMSELSYYESPRLSSTLADEMDIDDDRLLLTPSNAKGLTPQLPHLQHDYHENSIHASTSLPTPEKHLKYSSPPLTGSFVRMVCPRTGKTFYLPKSVQTKKRTKQDEIVKNITKSTHLLGKPIWKMLEEIRQDAEEKAILMQKAEMDMIQGNKSKGKKAKHRVREANQLWVDKYRPQTFVDLLGDQRVNRDVLRWVKQWDYCVFGKLPPQESQREKALRQYKNTFGSKPSYDEESNRPNKLKDSLLRPEQKILLISGPPGFGKTTLAHIVAKHAGYNTIEINASDDRTGSVVQTKIKSALEMQAIFTERQTSTGGNTPQMASMEQRPNMLIIDEIDGVSSSGGSDSFIQKLVQLATADLQDASADRRKGKSKPQTPLLRPIICICNDLYVPALRPLRAVSHCVSFRPIPMLTVARRLQEICDYEGLQSDLKTLSTLSETMNGDIRSCLNTLQFIQGKGSSVTRGSLSEAGLDQKDAAKSLFTIWEEIFNAPDARKKTSVQKASDGDKYLGRLTRSVIHNGETERIMQGCFESYIHMRFHDVAMQKCVQMSEWLDFYDHVNHRANVLHENSMYGFLPYPIVNFHRFFAGSTFQEHRVEYPRVDYTNYTKRKALQSVIELFLSGVHPVRRRFFDRTIVATELMPRLIGILSPELRPVNKQLLKPAEKMVLSRLIDIMIEFGLTFVQEKTSGDQFAYHLDPPVEQILNFEQGAKSTLPHRYAIRQLLSQEIETELLRRREEAADSRSSTDSFRTRMNTPANNNIIEKLMNDGKTEKDFFGRSIVRDTAPETVQENQAAKKAVGISYRYHEGFSNAVRKPVLVRELI